MVIIKDQIDTRLPQGDMSGILLRDCNWSVRTAGPSPDDNRRTEIFLLGCKKAMSGNACKGCFNSTTWDASTALWSHDPYKMAEHINNNAPNKYITIGGGEPTDQIDNLIILCSELKKYGFHIMLYTWRDLKSLVEKKGLRHHPKKFNRWKALDPEGYKDIEEDVFRGAVQRLIKYVDIIVDGEYKAEERLWDGTKEDGLISSVGSGNQIIWDVKHKEGFAMRDIDFLWIRPEDNELVYILKDLDRKCHEIRY